MNAPALPASAADYIAHIDLAFELMVVLDASGRIVRANAAARRPRAERCDHNVTSGHALKWCDLGAPLMKNVALSTNLLRALGKAKRYTPSHNDY